jgi:uncharacterized membrane protein (Fun14 family)
MIFLFSLLGFDFTLTNLGLVGLALLIGFIIGASLKHSFKIVLVLLVVMVACFALAPSTIASLNGILTLVNPLEWIQEILSLASASAAICMLFVGLALGLWRG